MQVIEAQGCHVHALIDLLTSPTPNVLSVLRSIPEFNNHVLTRDELANTSASGFYEGGTLLLARWRQSGIRVTLTFNVGINDLSIDLVDVISANGNGRQPEKGLHQMHEALHAIIKLTSFTVHTLTLTSPLVLSRKSLLLKMYERPHHHPGEYERTITLRTYAL